MATPLRNLATFTACGLFGYLVAAVSPAASAALLGLGVLAVALSLLARWHR